MLQSEADLLAMAEPDDLAMVRERVEAESILSYSGMGCEWDRRRCDEGERMWRMRCMSGASRAKRAWKEAPGKVYLTSVIGPVITLATQNLHPGYIRAWGFTHV